MSRPTIRIYIESGVFIDREMNDAEYDQYEIDQAKFAAEKAEAEAKVAKRVELLSRLGITEEEARILLG